MITEWDKLITRIKSEVSFRLGSDNGNKSNRIVAVKLVLLLDNTGRPLIWTMEGRKIEPSSMEAGNMAKEYLELL